MFNRRTWTKEENEQLQEGMASLGGPEANLGKNVSYRYRKYKSRSRLLLQQWFQCTESSVCGFSAGVTEKLPLSLSVCLSIALLGLFSTASRGLSLNSALEYSVCSTTRLDPTHVHETQSVKDPVN